MECALRINIYRKVTGDVDTENHIYGGNGGNYGVDVGSRLLDSEQIILSLIKKDGTLTAKKISENTEIPKRTVERILRQLKDKKLIVRRGSNRSEYWESVK